jgi:hypothetical protein
MIMDHIDYDTIEEVKRTCAGGSDDYVQGMKNKCSKTQMENGLLGGLLGSLILIPFIPLFGESRFMASASPFNSKHLLIPMLCGIAVGGIQTLNCKYNETKYERDYISVCSGN